MNNFKNSDLKKDEQDNWFGMEHAERISRYFDIDYGKDKAYTVTVETLKNGWEMWSFKSLA